MVKYNTVLLLFSIIFSGGCRFFPHGEELGVGYPYLQPDVNYVDDFTPYMEDLDKKKSADFLFVVDTSYPMVKHLQKVDETFKNFVSNLSPITWRMAFTNADYDSNAFSYYGRDLFSGKTMQLELNGNILSHTFLHSSSQYRKEIFIDTLKRYEEGDVEHLPPTQYINPCDLPPYCQGSIRSPIRSLMNSLVVNKGLIRKGSNAFIVVIFTNGDDIYVQDDVVDSFVNKFQEQYGSQKTIKIYSISIIPGDQECFHQDQATNYFSDSSYGTKIYNLVQATGGEVLSICSPDYSHLASMIMHSL